MSKRTIGRWIDSMLNMSDNRELEFTCKQFNGFWSLSALFTDSEGNELFCAYRDLNTMK
jgi:hypothetical protein